MFVFGWRPLVFYGQTRRLVRWNLPFVVLDFAIILEWFCKLFATLLQVLVCDLFAKLVQIFCSSFALNKLVGKYCAILLESLTNLVAIFTTSVVVNLQFVIFSAIFCATSTNGLQCVFLFWILVVNVMRIIFVKRIINLNKINKPENQDKDALGKIEHLSYIY